MSFWKQSKVMVMAGVAIGGLAGCGGGDPAVQGAPTDAAAASVGSEAPTGEVAASADGPARLVPSGTRVTKSLRSPGAVTVTLERPAAVAAVVAAPADFHPAGYALEFADEFDGTSLDRTKWCTRYLQGGGTPLQVQDAECIPAIGWGTLDFLSDEQQRYVDFNTAGEAMHVVGGGTLTLRATQTGTDAYASYQSAMIRSKQMFRPSSTTSYYITSRVMLPNVRGTWPAFWLAPSRNPDGSVYWPPEIDIFEGALNETWDTANMLRMGAQPQNWGGQAATNAHQTTYAAPEYDVNRSTFVSKTSLRSRWVEAGIEWTEKQVCFFLDGYKTACEAYEWKGNNGALAAPAPLLMNLAIGGFWAGAFGVDALKFPTSMAVDRIRVYKR